MSVRAAQQPLAYGLASTGSLLGDALFCFPHWVVSFFGSRSGLRFRIGKGGLVRMFGLGVRVFAVGVFAEGCMKRSGRDKTVMPLFGGCKRRARL